MGLVQTTPQSAIDAQIQRQLAIYERRIVRFLNVVGKECVNRAKLDGFYTDRTKNLRSSIGYIIVKDGSIIGGGQFTGQGEKGKEEGEDFAKSLVAKYPFGYALIVVAGMNYAGYVEAMGYDVLISQELYAAKRIKELMAQL